MKTKASAGAAPAATTKVLPKRHSLASSSNPVEKKLSQLKKLSSPETKPIKEVLIFDIDETLLAGDKHVITPEREAKINAMGDRKVVRIKADDPRNTFGEEITYVLRPGVKALLEYLTARGYAIILSTRNLGARAEVIVKTDPVLSKYVLGTLGMEDLLSPLNKDFEKFPDHPDRLTGWRWFKATCHTTFVYAPWYMFAKCKSLFTGDHIRWSPGVGTLGKHPPNMLHLLKAKLKSKAAKGELTSREQALLKRIDKLPTSRFLIDNQHESRECADSSYSRTWASVQPDTNRSPDGKSQPGDFFDDSIEPKIQLKNPKTGEIVEGYQWVKQVIEDIERGWEAHFKKTTGLDPVKSTPPPLSIVDEYLAKEQKELAA